MRLFLNAVLVSACLVQGAAAQNSAPIETDPKRISLLWDKLTGTVPNDDYYARRTGEYLSAQEIDRERVYNKIVSERQAYRASTSPEGDTYVIRIPSNMSAYDPRAGGFFLPLFSGRSFVPINSVDLHFINPDEFVFWPMPETEARAFMNKAGPRPQVRARFLYRPLVAPLVPMVAGSDKRIFGQVTQVELLVGRDTVYTSRRSQLTEAQAKAEFEKANFAPTKNELAMVWHKIVDGPAYDIDKSVNLRTTSTNNFSDEDRKRYFKRYYDQIDPAKPFTMLVAAEFAGYDAAKGEFPLKIDEPIQYKSLFPYAVYADDQARIDKINEGKRPRFFKQAKTNTIFAVDYSNEDAIGGLKTDPAGAARLRSDPTQTYKARAQLTVIPVNAETIVNFEGTKARKVLHTRIAKARIFDQGTGQLLIEKTFGEIAPMASVPHAIVDEGVPDFDGLNPYEIDFRGIKLGMTEAQMRAAAKAHFREVRTSASFAPGYMKLFAKDDRLGVTFCTDNKICSMSYTRTWQGEVVRDVYDAAIEKYGEPVSGRRPYDTRGRGMAREASMNWTRNIRRVGGVDGSVSLVAGTTYLKISAVDKTKQRKKKQKPKISLD